MVLVITPYLELYWVRRTYSLTEQGVYMLKTRVYVHVENCPACYKDHTGIRIVDTAVSQHGITFRFFFKCPTTGKDVGVDV